MAQRAYALRFEDAAEMLALAELAVEQAACEPKETQAFACAHLGNALRINGSFNLAAAALDRAAELYSDPNPLVLSFRASLHQDRRELIEAQSCLAAAAELVSDRQMRGKLLVKSTYVIDLAGHHRQAADIVQKALDLLDDPLLVASTIHLLAMYLTNAGETGRALAVLREGAPALALLGRLGQLRRVWLEGRIAATCRDYDTALVRLQEAREGFAAECMLQEVALVGLEVSLAAADKGLLWTARMELEGVREVLEALGISDETAAAEILGSALRAKNVAEFGARVAELRVLVANFKT